MTEAKGVLRPESDISQSDINGSDTHSPKIDTILNDAGEPVSLGDKFDKRDGRIFISGIQALVRLSLIQREEDRKAGLNTAGFISGYRGSPLGGVDGAMHAEKKRLEAQDVLFRPGLNEIIAATAVRGSQEVSVFGKTQKDGVFGIWYGKAPGVDQAMDAIRHGHAAGTTPNGGVLAIAGDDHSASSSTLAAQTDMNFMTAGVPVLYPSGHNEFVRFGRLGIEMSRFSGGWVALKTTADTIEGGGSADLSVETQDIIKPQPFKIEQSHGSDLHMFQGDSNRFEQSDRVAMKLSAAEEFARVNKINFSVFQGQKDKIGIVTSGKAYNDVRQALYELGIDTDEAEKLGVRLFKVGMVYPLEKESITEFCEGLDHVLVVEEGRPIVEDQIKSLLFNKRQNGDVPSVSGKLNREEAPQFSTTQGFSVAAVTKVLAEYLLSYHDDPRIQDKLDYYKNRLEMTGNVGPVVRKAHFCSGCPHSRSTKVPEGSRAMGGIGCHIMAVWNYDRETNEFSQMGSEGTSWIGQAPFTDEDHIFSNLGDGTYQHSGSLAIRANVLAGNNITYKILYNDAVAMTGGQSLEGSLDVDQIAKQVEAEGVDIDNIVIVSEDPKRLKKMQLDKRIRIHDRKEMNVVQEDMRTKKGVSVLIYDQGCAAEKRRKRKRGIIPEPDTHMIINQDICEGCGDCSVQSSCVSILPLETELGRKRAIDQTTCNKDYSCVDGFCPSFIAVKGAALKRTSFISDADQEKIKNLPEAKCKTHEDHYNILLGGIGGTGIVTLSALLGMAAHLEGKASITADLTGISQKGGAVFSHVRIAKNDTPKGMWSSRIISGGADLLMACDDIVGASADVIDKCDMTRTSAIVNGDLTPTIDFSSDGNFDFLSDQTLNAVRAQTRRDDFHTVNAKKISNALASNSIGSNIFMLGYAYQKGLIPLKAESIEKAIRLNGVSVEANMNMLSYGRLCAHDPVFAQEILAKISGGGQIVKPYHEKPLNEIMDHRIKLLTDYQSAAYAGRYEALVKRVQEAEEKLGLGEQTMALTKAVAHNYAKLLAYKDEYEVARLHTSQAAMDRLKEQFESGGRMSIYMSPPFLPKVNRKTGVARKYHFGPWVLPVLRMIKRFKFLRGSMFDPFSYSKDRKLEQKLIRDYEADVELVLSALNDNNYKRAMEVVKLPETMRGFGHVKEAAVEKAYDRRSYLIKGLKPSVAAA